MAINTFFAHRFVILLVIAVYAVDQGTKLLVSQTIPLCSSVPATGFFRITHVANTGSAFGLFGGQNLVLIAASVLGVGVLAWFYRSHPEPSVAVRTSLGLMLAGALGNLTDRLVYGHVKDFIDIGPWYIFNVADSAITVGVLIMLYVVLTSRERAADGPQSEEPAAADAPADDHAYR